MNPIWYWKLAIWKCVTAVVVVVGVGLPTIILNWDTMTNQGRTVAVIGLGLACWKAVDVFLDQTVSRLAQGKPPIQINGNGHSEVVTEAKITTTTTTDKTEQPKVP